MFVWPQETAERLRLEFVEVYWVLITIVALIAIILEFFKIAEKQINPVNILKRVTVSVILLWTFKEVANFASDLTEGMIDRLGGMQGLMALYDLMGKSYQSDAPSLFKYREMFIYFLSWFCYAVGMLGYYVMTILINIAYSILYILSPLLILAYVSEKTAYITSSLYKGIFNVCTWKVLWCIMGFLLVELSTMPQTGGWDGFFMSALTNLLIGVSMLMIPVFANSLFGSGLSDSVASGSAMLAKPVTDGMAKLPRKAMGKTWDGMAHAFGGAKEFTQRRFDNARKRREERKHKRAEDANATLMASGLQHPDTPTREEGPQQQKRRRRRYRI